MRTIVGYRDGKAIWSDNAPARGRLPWAGTIGGGIVIGHSVPKGEPTSIQAMHKKALRIRKAVS